MIRGRAERIYGRAKGVGGLGEVRRGMLEFVSFAGWSYYSTTTPPGTGLGLAGPWLPFFFSLFCCRSRAGPSGFEDQNRLKPGPPGGDSTAGTYTERNFVTDFQIAEICATVRVE